ncbi:MAG: PQQ-binding-like beta-propeller repeat protein [Verrucomicrobiales bacterium]
MKQKLRLILAAAAAFSLGTAPAPAQWPQFRGPEGNGHTSAKNLPVRWSATENIAWKTPLPGEGWSSPVLGGGKLYLTAAVEPGGDQEGAPLSLQAICLDAATGAILWAREAFPQRARSPKIHSKNSHASPTPILALEAGRLYAHFGHEGTACFDLDGNRLWANRELNYAPVHGGGGSPALVDGKLIFSCDGASSPFVAALRAKDGTLLWKTPRDTDAKKTFSFSTPLAIEVGDRPQVVVPGSNRVVAYDPDSGDPVWFVRYEGYSVVPRPIFAGGIVYVSSAFDNPVVYAIRPAAKKSGDITAGGVVWSETKRAPNTPSMLAAGDEVYWVSDGGLATCADAKTGELHWQERACGPCSASPLYAAETGLIYIQDERGKGVVIKADKAFKIVAQSDLGERTLASHAAEDGAFYIRGEAHLFKIAAEK